MNYPGRLGAQNHPAQVRDFRRVEKVDIAVKYLAREWPFGRIVLGVGDGIAVLTPNHARRVLDMLERAIQGAEDRCR